MKQAGVPLAFTNCISEYPPKYEDINLKFILQMEKHFPDAIIGHSDHTPDLYTSFGAVTLGARIIEKHVILDKRTPGPDQSVSIDFQELHQLVDGIRKLEDALGSVKKCTRERKKRVRGLFAVWLRSVRSKRVSGLKKI